MTPIIAKRHPSIYAILGVLLAAGLTAIPACSKYSNSSVTVILTNAPSILTVNQAVRLTANVLNDNDNRGVDWTSTAGTFNPAHTVDGGTTVYTAPSSTGTVTISATATADSQVVATATISIVAIGSNTVLNGTYVFQVQGVDTNGGYVAVGTITADGNGNITSGEQDYADETLQAGPDQLTGSYSIGPDGRGSVTLAVSNTALPHNGVETFSLAVTSTTHAFIIQFDATATSTGTLDAQPAGVAVAGSIAGPYAFTLGGSDIAAQVPMASGGIATLNAGSGLLTNGSFFENDGGVVSSAAFSGTVTAPDAFGRGTITTGGGFHYVYYLVQSEVLRLVQEDVPSFVAGGTMVGQGPAGSTPIFSNASLTGNYVFSDAGGSVLGSMALVGQFTANGTGGFTAGFADLNEGGSNSSGSIAALSSYTIAADGTGNLTLPGALGATQDVASLIFFATDPNINLIDPSDPNGGGGALVLDFDNSTVGAGVIIPQTSGTVTGDYAVSLQFITNSGENDLVGQIVADGAGNLSGSVDLNNVGVIFSTVGLTGTYAADSVNPGRFTGTFTVSGNVLTITYYQVSSGMLLILDTDSSIIGIGTMETD